MNRAADLSQAATPPPLLKPEPLNPSRYNALVYVPYQLERLLWFGTFICCDSFLVGLVPRKLIMMYWSMAQWMHSTASHWIACREHGHSHLMVCLNHFQCCTR